MKDLGCEIHPCTNCRSVLSGLISVGTSAPLRETAGALDAVNLPLVSVVSPHSDGDAADVAQGRKEILILATIRRHDSYFQQRILVSKKMPTGIWLVF